VSQGSDLPAADLPTVRGLRGRAGVLRTGSDPANMLAGRSRRLSPNWLRTSPCASNARSSKLRKSRVMHLPTYRTHVRASASRCAGLTHVIEVSTATPTRDALRLAKSAIKAGLAAGGQVSGPPRLILLARGRVRAGRGVEGVEPDGRRRARRPRRRDARSDLGRPAAHPRGRRHRRDPARRHERARHGRRSEARSRAAATPHDHLVFAGMLRGADE
jgi:hypothetical protein